MKASIIYFFILLVLSSCKYIEVKDGHISKEFLPSTKKYSGIYHGTFETKSSQIEIRFNGDAPELIYTDKFGHEILDEKCHSKIGKLNRLALLDEKNRIFSSQAVFEFDPGACKEIQGRELILTLKDENRFILEIYEETVPESYCNQNGCYENRKFTYLKGSFSR
jgi:hypothetical protein